jgi:hypothetical protein
MRNTRMSDAMYYTIVAVLVVGFGFGFRWLMSALSRAGL